MENGIKKIIKTHKWKKKRQAEVNTRKKSEEKKKDRGQRKKEDKKQKEGRYIEKVKNKVNVRTRRWRNVGAVVDSCGKCRGVLVHLLCSILFFVELVCRIFLF